jgi:hypothetical protein
MPPPTLYRTHPHTPVQTAQCLVPYISTSYRTFTGDATFPGSFIDTHTALLQHIDRGFGALGGPRVVS